MSWRSGELLKLASGGIVVALMVHAVLTVDFDFSGDGLFEQMGARLAEAEAARAHGLPKAPLPPSLRPIPTDDRLAEMPCFGCHSLERYQSETRFGHAQHRVAGQCHVCNAFSQHFEVVVRKEHCGDCHTE